MRPRPSRRMRRLAPGACAGRTAHTTACSATGGRFSRRRGGRGFTGELNEFPDRVLSRAVAVATLQRPKQLIGHTLERAGVAPVAFDVRDRVQALLDRDTRLRNRRFRAPDGLPMPPAHLIHKVVGHFDYELFYDGGVTRFAYLRDVLRRAGVEFEELGSVLDWGAAAGASCGTGVGWRAYRSTAVTTTHSWSAGAAARSRSPGCRPTGSLRRCRSRTTPSTSCTASRSSRIWMGRCSDLGSTSCAGSSDQAGTS